MNDFLEELKQEIGFTGYKINRYCDYLIGGNHKRADKFVQVVVDALSSLMPKVIKAYNEVGCLKGEDSSIWGIQLNRILDALSTDDDIRKIDVLKMETVENLGILLEALESDDE